MMPILMLMSIRRRCRRHDALPASRRRFRFDAAADVTPLMLMLPLLFATRYFAAAAMPAFVADMEKHTPQDTLFAYAILILCFRR